jgi:ZIP family zinc transporter
MLGALVFGLVASSALVIGAVAGAYWTPPRLLLASALAFASGVLITALAFDLFDESFKRGGAWLSAIGLLAGAAAFVAADELLDRYIRRPRNGRRLPALVPDRRRLRLISARRLCKPP